MKLGGNIAS